VFTLWHQNAEVVPSTVVTTPNPHTCSGLSQAGPGVYGCWHWHFFVPQVCVSPAWKNMLIVTATRGTCRNDVDAEFRSADCPQNVQLKWMAEATSSIYATPLITDLYADGFKDIIVPSFVHHLEVFQGDNGAQAAGFPAFHADRVHASPLMFDIDRDGIHDIVVSTYSGEILFYQDSGAQLPLKFAVPRLPVKRHDLNRTMAVASSVVGLAVVQAGWTNAQAPGVVVLDRRVP
jgi:hypothetical protein